MRPDHSSVRDIAKYPEMVWLDRLWMAPGVLMAAACYGVGYLCDGDGLPGLVYGYCLSMALVFQVTFAVNSVGHMFGPQRFATGDGSRNNFLVGVLAMGDGWHNNHHQAPSSARHGFAWYEFDISYQFIKLLRRVGLAWDVRVPSAEVLAGRAGRPDPVVQ